MVSKNWQAALDNISMHTYAKTLTTTVKRPQLIDGATNRAWMRLAYTHRVPLGFELDQLRFDQTTLIRNGVIQAMWEDSDKLLSMYRVTTIGRGQPQAPTHRQLVAGNKSRLSNPMLECSAQRTPESHQQNRPQGKTWKNTARQWEGP